MATTQKIAQAEQRIVLYDVSWETYETLLANYIDSSMPRLVYDRGVLEIVSPSTTHEEMNRTLAYLVRVIASETGLDYRDVGSMTYKREEFQRGFEPDSSFYIQHEPQVAGTRQIDLAVDPPPDLVIESDVASSSPNKLPIYTQLGVPEVWRYEETTDEVTILRLHGEAYRSSTDSGTLPPLSDDALTRLVRQSRTMKSGKWLRELRAWIREVSDEKP